MFPTLNRRQLMSGLAGLLGAAVVAPKVLRADGKTILRVRSYIDASSFDPAFARSRETDSVVNDAIYSKLIGFVPGTQWEWELDAAESIERIDDTHIAFKLKPGIQWTNGFGEMTAEDVKFSFERIADPEFKSPYQGDWSFLDHVEVTGSHSGVIVLKEPYAPLFTTTLPWGAGNIVCKKAVEAAGGTYTGEVPASSGMFQLKEWRPNDRIVLVRNDAYYDAPSPFDEVEIIPIGDDKTAELAFEAGDIDYTNVAVSSIQRLETALPAGAKLQVRPAETYYWIGMNVDHPKFQDIRVRQAVQYAIDADQIIEAAFFGAAVKATGMVAPGLVGHRERNLIEKRDPDKARALLAEAGLADGFSTTISVLNQTDRVAAAQVIQAQLAEVGIIAEVLPYESGVYWSLGQQSDGEMWKDLQISFLRYAVAPDPSWALMWFTCDQVGVWNWERWCSPEFDRLWAEGAAEMDPAKRQPIYVKMQDLMEESGAYVFVAHEPNAVLYRDTIVPGNRPNNDTMVRFFTKA